MNGSGNEWGTANTRLREDRLYAPADSDEWSTEMERRERVTANAKAMAEAAYTDAEEQLAQLDALRAEVEAAPDVTAVTAQSAAVALAHQRLSANQAMLEQARLLLTADDRVTQQRSEQRWRRDVDAWVKKTAPALEGW
jgi:Type IV secretion system proteins